MIVSVCAWLTNFQPVLIPLPAGSAEEDEVDKYFSSVLDSESDSDYDADTELTDEED